MQKANVLIVDDVQINRELLAFILQDRYQVFQAENGAEAIEMIQSRERIYRLVLLDIQMPVMDGFGFLEYMKEHNLLRQTPVIVISGESSDGAILHAYKLGASDFFTKPFSQEIVLNRVQNILTLHEHEYKDALSGGYNRNGFISMVETILYNAPNRRDFALMFLDIKNFKATNELFGTDGGDYILRECYARIQSFWQPVVSGRLDSDHFVCLVRRDRLDLETLASRLQIPVQLKGRSMKIYAYCGIYCLDDSDVDVLGMIDRAKLAEESILSDHVQPFVLFDDSMRQMYLNQVQIMGEHEAAILNEEFQVFYQPVVEAATGKLVSAEALIRWVHPRRGMVSPAVFIPALENSGQISKLDWFVTEHVYQTLVRCRQERIPIVPVSVNLSWMDFYDDDLIDRLVKIYRDGALCEGDLRLEITETSYAAMESDQADILRQLRQYGAKFLLDDFGSGYSSFGMLKRYDFDILKLDMSFTRQLETNEKVRTIVSAILNLVHQLGIQVVAEGAETERQVAFLREHSCDFIQGYYFSKPLPEEEFLAYVKKCRL